MSKESTGTGAYWRDVIVEDGTTAAEDAAVGFAAITDLADTTGSTLYAMGEAIAYAFRRRVLRAELQLTGWNLAHVADRLRIKSAGKVLAAIRAHGLDAEYEAAKSAGVARGKGKRLRRVIGGAK